jgi:hypothetical protein
MQSSVNGQLILYLHILLIPYLDSYGNRRFDEVNDKLVTKVTPKKWQTGG